MKGVGVVRSKRETLPNLKQNSVNLGPGYYNISKESPLKQISIPNKNSVYFI